MKIVFVTDLYYPPTGGVEIETRRLVAKLSSLGHDVWIVVPSKGNVDTEDFEGKVKVYGIGSFFRPVGGVRFVPFSIAKKKVYKILGRIGPDVVHIQTAFSLAMAAGNYAKQFGVACVATGHYAEGEVENFFSGPKSTAKLLDFMVRKAYQKVWKNVDIVTFPSEFSRRYFYKDVGDASRVLVISNGIESEKFLSRSKETSNNTILYVGRIEPSKDIGTIIKSLPKILTKVDVNLVIVGEGADKPHLKKLAKELKVYNRVLFAGFLPQEKVQEIYKKASVFVTASLAENQPLVVLEAMASGLPIVATNVGGIPEMVRDGENGFLFESRDSDGLAEKVIKILLNKNLAARMGKKSLAIAKEHDINEVIYKVESLYRRAIVNSVQKETLPVPASHRWLFVRVTFAIIMLGFLFRWTFLAPSTARAKGVSMGERIRNLKVVKGIERMDARLKADFSNKFLKKLEE